MRICNPSFKKVQIRAKKIFFVKKSIRVSKNAKFHADFESVEKVLKKCTKKSYYQKRDRNMHFFHFYSCFNEFKISVKFCVFWHLFDFFKKNFFLGHIRSFFKLWSLTRKKRLKKSKNVFCECVLDFNFAPIKGSVFFIF
jgi:hypothetical protein